MVSLMPKVCKGRPREFDVDEALAAALRVFWSKGYEGASLTDLTEAMGITRPSLYAAFGNKEALFRKALDLYEREKLAYVGEALAAPTSREVAERLLTGALEMQTSECEPRGCMRVISTISCGQEAESVRADLMARRGSSHQAMLRPDAAGQGRGRSAGACRCRGDDRLSAGHPARACRCRRAAARRKEQLQQVVRTSIAIWPGK